MQLGVDFSTSQVENNFIGTGLFPVALAAFVDNDANPSPTTANFPLCSAILFTI